MLQAALYLSSGKIAQGGIRRVATPCCIGREFSDESHVNAATTGLPFPTLHSFKTMSTELNVLMDFDTLSNFPDFDTL